MGADNHDIAIIGGGVNGCGIARDAAGRGFSVLLLERNDLASGTSSASTKLIHGGLRYLEHFEFALVRESLSERERLLRIAPHIAWPMRFILPHHQGLRPWWMLRLGLFLYDHLGGRKLLPATSTIDLRRHPAGSLLEPLFTRAFEYSDCWVDDARLVTLNAVDAKARGADIRLGTEVTGAKRQGDHWILDLREPKTGAKSTAKANIIVNAAGPWVSQIVSGRFGIDTKSSTRLVRGSHIVVNKLFDHDKAYIFQNEDNRIIFAIPYQDDFTLIGTTDVPVDDPDTGAITSQEEIDYLCQAASAYFKDPVKPGDVVHTYAGIRPLYDDGESAAQEISRDYVLELEGSNGEAPLLNIFGGKITTFRLLAEEALEKLRPHLPQWQPAWTATAALPGGDFPVDGFDKLCADLQNAHRNVDALVLRRLARNYGTRASVILNNAQTENDLGWHFGAGLYECEVSYLLHHEMARTAEDILWRRSKRGLHLSEGQQAVLQNWIEAR